MSFILYKKRQNKNNNNKKGQETWLDQEAIDWVRLEFHQIARRRVLRECISRWIDFRSEWLHLSKNNLLHILHIVELTSLPKEYCNVDVDNELRQENPSQVSEWYGAIK